jgi:hypothetical protein
LLRHIDEIEIRDGCWIEWRSLRPLVRVVHLYQTIALLLRNCPTLERSGVALDAAHSQSIYVAAFARQLLRTPKKTTFSNFREKRFYYWRRFAMSPGLLQSV